MPPLLPDVGQKIEVVNCDTQDEINYIWKVLIEDGGSEVECGWLRDKFGLSWQVVPVVLDQMMTIRIKKNVSV